MSQGGYQKAIEYVEKRLKIAKDIGDRVEEGRTYGNLGNAYDSLRDYHKANRAIYTGEIRRVLCKTRLT